MWAVYRYSVGVQYLHRVYIALLPANPSSPLPLRCEPLDVNATISLPSGCSAHIGSIFWEVSGLV